MYDHNFISYLKTLPENSGQLVDLKCSDKIIRCYFMWFNENDTIDLKPVGNIGLLTVPLKHWGDILPCITVGETFTYSFGYDFPGKPRESEEQHLKRLEVYKGQIVRKISNAIALKDVTLGLCAKMLEEKQAREN